MENRIIDDAKLERDIKVAIVAALIGLVDLGIWIGGLVG
jgi:hypothetical protein